MTVEELYQLVIDGLSQGTSLDEIAEAKALKFDDFVYLARHAVYMEDQYKHLVAAIESPEHVDEMKQLFGLSQNPNSDNDLESISKNFGKQLILIQDIKTYFSLEFGNLADVAQSFNQFYAEARFADGNKAPDITSISYAAAEGFSSTMIDGQFYSSEQGKSPLRISGNPALLSSKHNACPLVIGLNSERTKSLAWHIRYSNIAGPTASKKIPTLNNLDKFASDGITYIALGLSKGVSHELPDSINPIQYYSLPTGIHIQTIVVRGEPASYDTSYYPKSDTLIVWGKDTSGAVCAWQMSDAVFGSGQEAWKKAVLGTTENPMLYWQQFLAEHYSTLKSPKEIQSEDALMRAFIKYSNKEHKDLSGDNNQLTANTIPISSSKPLTFHSEVIIAPENSIRDFKHNVKFEETDDGLKITFDLGEYRCPNEPRFIEATLAKDGTFTLPVEQFWQDTSIADKPLIVKVGGDHMFNNFDDVLNSTRAFPGGDAQFHLLHKELAKFCEKHDIKEPERKSFKF